jgi:hypothetical protein
MHMSGGSQNSTTQSTVPSWLEPYITGELQQGNQDVQGGGPQYYPGQQVAPLTSMQNQGIAGIEQQSQDPSASGTAQQQNMNIESGAYLNPATNPYLAGTLNTADQGVQNQISSEFAGSGRNIVGSAPVQSSAMNQLANQIYGGAYQSGMQNMVQAQYASPSLDQGTYAPYQELLQTGAGVQGQNQNEINALMNQYNYQQQLPENMLSWYSGLLSQNGAPFAGQTSTASGSNNKNTQALGGAASGAAAGTAIFPGWGTAIGGLLGGLGGYFG